MDYSGYMFELRNLYPRELGHVEQFFLEEIFKGEYNSAYKMWKYLEKQSQYTTNRDGDQPVPLKNLELVLRPIDHKMAYKNVWSRFERLEELGLIEKIEGKFERGAIYYKVTEHGIMCLDPYFYFSDRYVEQRNQSIVWRTLVLQFFEEKTVQCMEDDFTLEKEILHYVRNCIRDTIDSFKHFRNNLARFNIVISENDLEYYFRLKTTPSLYKDNIRNEDGKNRAIWKKIDTFEDKFPYVMAGTAEEYSAISFDVNWLENELKWDIKYLIFRLLCHKELGRSKTSTILGRDQKFRLLAEQIKNEFQQGCHTLNIL